MKQVMLMIGTRKGGFLAVSDVSRKSWELQGPVFKGVEVNFMALVPDAPPVIYIAGKSAWWGPDLRMSRDFGHTWVEPTTPVRFAAGRGLSLERIWVIAADPRADQEGVYVGVDPATLLRSTDGGHTWEDIRALTDHPTRHQWAPGAGGMMVHSMCHDPRDPRRMFVAISAAGVFRTDDGGQTWTPKNKGVRADFLPEKFPAVGQCTHHLEIHPSHPDILYQQNHCGVYRSDNAGDEWIDISAGLPSRFGFPLAVHPHDGDTIYVIPEESDQCHLVPDGALRVYRSKNRGDTWEALTDGLPQVHAFQNVLRAAMTTDPLDPPGVYVGTQGGHILASRDAGDHWALLFNWLPPVYSLQAAVIER
jgi:photosystem II stability/assembly factor-like uncharacterized protein